MTPGLARAVREVDERIRAGRCTPPTPEEHPQNLIGLGECIEWVEEQRKAAQPAA